jgi:hypothetical protein
MTRPSKADCDAIAAPSPAGASTDAVASSSSAASSSGAVGAGPTAGGQGTSGPQPAEPGSAAPARAGAAWNAGSASVTGVDAGGTYTLSGSGFQPGERVTVHLTGSGTVLASATAGPDGSVRARVQLPAQSDGAQSVDLVGDRSEVSAGVRLQVSSAQTPVGPRGTGNLWALIAACVAFVSTVGGLVSVVGSRRAAPQFRRA